MFSGFLSQGAKQCFGGKTTGSLAIVRNATVSGMGLRACARPRGLMMMPQARRGFALLDPNMMRNIGISAHIDSGKTDTYTTTSTKLGHGGGVGRRLLDNI